MFEKAYSLYRSRKYKEALDALKNTTKSKKTQELEAQIVSYPNYNFRKFSNAYRHGSDSLTFFEDVPFRAIWSISWNLRSDARWVKEYVLHL